MIICPARILLNTFHIFQPAGEQLLLFPSISALGQNVPKLRHGVSAPRRRQLGSGRLPNKHFGKHFCRRTAQKILNVFTLELLAKNTSVATLALLAVSAYLGKDIKNESCIYYTSSVFGFL